MSNPATENKSVQEEITLRESSLEYWTGLVLQHIKSSHGGYLVDSCDTCGNLISSVNSEKEIIQYLRGQLPTN